MSFILFIKRALLHARYKVRHFSRSTFYRAKYGAQFNPDKNILVAGFPESRNFGDALNVYLVEFLSGKKVMPARYVNRKEFPVYAVIGSILHWVNEGDIVWGAGLISDEVKVPGHLEVKAVRGPLTRSRLQALGMENCPTIYGDPALLMPLIYCPDRPRTYQYGILPHYSDREHPALKDLKHLGSHLLLDIQTGANVLPLIDQLLSCKVIVTSSLHGLILAHTYGIPCVWVGFFGNLFGDTFKFHDYLQSVGREPVEPLKIEGKIHEQQLLENLDDQPISWDSCVFIEACPFISAEVKEQLLAKATQELR